MLFDNLTSEEQLTEIEDDLKVELSKFGQIQEILVPKPSWLSKEVRKSDEFLS